MTHFEKERQRVLFEQDAIVLDFDLSRVYIDALVEPWCEYSDDATGHRWAGWLAACEANNIT